MEIILKIRRRDLLLFYVERKNGWKEMFIHSFIEKEIMDIEYQLDKMAWATHPPRGEYKFVVWVKERQNPGVVRRSIEAGSYIVTREGHDPKSGRTRIWFYDPRKPTRGEGGGRDACNVWE